MRARIAELGGTPLPGSPADFAKLFAAETEKWAKVVKISGAKATLIARLSRAHLPPSIRQMKPTGRRPEHRASEGNQMGRTLAAFVVAASLLTLASSEASAWVCRAIGLGSSGYYDIIDAKLFALRQCERRSPLPVCTLVWCRPGG